MTDQLDNARLNAELRRLLEDGDDGRRDMFTAFCACPTGHMTRELLPNAPWTFEIQISGAWYVMEVPYSVKRHDEEGYVPWIWANRNGKPWQAALETHVANYREPAPDYDWHVLVTETLPKAGITIADSRFGPKSIRLSAYGGSGVITWRPENEYGYQEFIRDDPQLAEKVKAWAVQVLREHKQGEGA